MKLRSITVEIEDGDGIYEVRFWPTSKETWAESGYKWLAAIHDCGSPNPFHTTKTNLSPCKTTGLAVWTKYKKDNKRGRHTLLERPLFVLFKRTYGVSWQTPDGRTVRLQYHGDGPPKPYSVMQTVPCVNARQFKKPDRASDYLRELLGGHDITLTKYTVDHVGKPNSQFHGGDPEPVGVQRP